MKFNIFSSFEEAKEAQNYDHLFQKSLYLSTASGVEVGIIRDLNLHIQNTDGNFPLDDYIAQNNIVIDFPEVYDHAKIVWKMTIGWAPIFAYGNNYIYRTDHSDRTYPIVEIDDLTLLLPIDETGAVIPKFVLSENN